MAETDGASSSLPIHIQETIQSIAGLNAEHHANATHHQRVVDRITSLLGRAGFIATLTAFVVGEIVPVLWRNPVWRGWGSSRQGGALGLALMPQRRRWPNPKPPIDAAFESARRKPLVLEGMGFAQAVAPGAPAR